MVTFVNIWSGYPFFMISLLAGLQGISGELYEAASRWTAPTRCSGSCT